MATGSRLDMRNRPGPAPANIRDPMGFAQVPGAFNSTVKFSPSVTVNLNKLVRMAKSCDRAFRPILASIKQQAADPDQFGRALDIISYIADSQPIIQELGLAEVEPMFKTLPKVEAAVQTLYKKPLTAAHTSVITAFLNSVPAALRDYEPVLVLVSPRTPSGAAPPRFVAPLSPESSDLVGLTEEKRKEEEAGKRPENHKKIAGLVENLFRGGASNLEIQRNGLYKAIKEHDTHRLGIMIRDLQYDISQALSDDGSTALHVAAEMGYTECVDLLLQQGASTTARDKNKFAPIHRAASAGQMGMIRQLSPHTPPDVCQACIHLAAMGNQAGVIEGIVLSKAASIDCPSAKGRDTPLHLAARNGANEALAMCLKLKADVSLKNAEGRSALQEALYSRSIKKELLQELLEKTVAAAGGDASVLHLKDVHGKSLLHGAAASDDADVCRRLLAMHFDPNEVDAQGWTPLFEAARNGACKTFVALLEGGADPCVRAHDGSTVAHVLGPGSEDIARLLARDYPELLSVQNQKGEVPAMSVAKATDVSNEVVDILMAGTPITLLRECKDEQGRDILHVCLEACRVELVKQYLRSHEFNVNNVNTHTGASSLHVACAVAGDDIDLLALLVEKGANLRHQSRDGSTAAHILVSNDFTSGLEYVVKLDRGLTNMTNAKGQTPCHVAAENENAAALHLLLNTGVADLSLVDGEGDTVLHTAAKNGAEDVVGACIDAGVGLDQSRDGDGKTSVYEACYYGHGEVVRLLVDAGANLTKTDSKGWHPLHAAAWGHEADRSAEYAIIVRTLLKKGAPVDVENDEGSTPLYFASRRGHLSIVSELLKHKPRLRGKTYETDPLAASQTERKADVSVALLRAGYPVLEKHGGKDVFLYDAYGQTPFHNALILQDDVIERELPEPLEVGVLYELYPHVDWANLPDQRGLHPLVLTALIYDQPYCTFHLLKRGASMSKYVSGLRVMTKHFPSVEPYARFFQSETHLMALAAHFGRESSLTIAAFLRLEAPELGDTSIQELFPFAEAQKAAVPPMPAELSLVGG